MMRRLGCLLGIMGGIVTSAFPFSADEIDSIQRFWAQPNRYTVTAPAWATRDGEWQVRLTPEGSKWLNDYNLARGLGKVAPTQDAGPQNSEQEAWEVWINAKVTLDRAKADQEAAAKNGLLPSNDLLPADPGPIPDGLKTLAGEPPIFAAAVRPRLHVIRFPDGQESRLEDNVVMRPRYAFFRSFDGVMSGGRSMASMPDGELDRLYKQAGIDAFQRNVLEAVSTLEGGFDSVNTYDTGFVSVGFIQFASLSAGAGALGRVLLRMKENTPREFEVDFRRFGLDVSPDGKLVAVDLATGEEKVGPEANQEIIQDKRLIAVFQRAGRISDGFRLAQLRVAMDQFYPGDDAIEVKIGNQTWKGKVSDIVKTEAGMATLMDLKVNRGNIRSLAGVVAQIATQNDLKSLAEASDFEYQITRMMTYRKDYLAVAGLSKPRVISSQANRSGGPRTGRSGGTKPPTKKP